MTTTQRITWVSSRRPRGVPATALGAACVLTPCLPACWAGCRACRLPLACWRQPKWELCSPHRLPSHDLDSISPDLPPHTTTTNWAPLSPAPPAPTGTLHQNGYGVPSNMTLALSHFHNSTRLGSWRGPYLLVNVYAGGWARPGKEAAVAAVGWAVGWCHLLLVAAGQAA